MVGDRIKIGKYFILFEMKDEIFTLVVVGDGMVGKDCLISRALYNRYHADDNDPAPYNDYECTVNINNEERKSLK